MSMDIHDCAVRSAGESRSISPLSTAVQSAQQRSGWHSRAHNEFMTTELLRSIANA